MRALLGTAFPGWRRAGLCVVLSIAAPAARLAAEADGDDEALRQQAVSEYIEGATRELDAYGQQISAAARADNQPQVKAAKAKLDECGRILGDLKAADSAHFDPIKSEYEHARADLARALDAERKT